jgi:hypothetical protein
MGRRFGWYDFKPKELQFLPVLSIFEEKFKELQHEPFKQVQSFARIYGSSKK